MSEISVVVVGSTSISSTVGNGDSVAVNVGDQTIGGGNGAAATVQVGTVTTLGATASASVVNSGTSYAAKLDFGIPRGSTGSTGPANSLSISKVSTGATASVSISGTAPSQALSFVLQPGPQGSTGPANSLSIASVTTGTTAAVSISGTAPSQSLSFVLPQGPAGPANSLSVGSVSTGATAAVSISGTAPSQTLAFVLQPGPAGPYTTLQIGTVTAVSSTSNAAITTSSSGSTTTLNFFLPRGEVGSVNLADETPQPLGTASAGSAIAAARADHIHAIPVVSYTSLSNVPAVFTPASHTQAISSIDGLQTALDAKQATGTYCVLVNSLVPSANLPSYVDDVIDVGGTLPASGDVGKIYVVSSGGNTNKIYRWSGSAFIEISPSPGSTDSVTEGSVNLYFTDARAVSALSSALATKASTSHTHSATQVTDFSTEVAKIGNVVSVNGQTGVVTISTGSSLSLSDATPSALGVASAGTGTAASRSDHVHLLPTISYTALSNVPTSFVPSAHTHAASDISSGTFDAARLPTISYTALSNVPTSFAPASHTQGATTITGLAAIATSGSAADLSTGTIPTARIPIGGGLIAASGVIAVDVAPGAPTSITDNGSGTISWTPSTTGTSSLYDVQSTSDNGATYVSYYNGTSETNVTYIVLLGRKFRVRAKNAVGLYGPWGYQSGLTPQVEAKNLTIGSGFSTTDGTLTAAGGGASLSDSSPLPLGTAAAGTSTAASRSDHVHLLPTISYTALSNVPTSFTPSSHTQNASTISDFATEAAKYGPVTSVNGLTGSVTIATGGTGSSSYTLPNATTSSLGGVVVGTGLSVSSGTISANVVSVQGRTGTVSLAAADLTAVTSITTGTAATAVLNVIALSSAAYSAISVKSTTTLYIVSG